MSSSKKRDKQSVEDDKSETSTAEILSEFAEMLTQDIIERDLSHIDSFELYAHQLRTHLHANPTVFKNRFSAGYCVLLEELEKETIA